MIELLSPAGSMEALRAAVQNGANAVYLGYDQFNARMNAKNFSADELQEAIVYCHVRGVAGPSDAEYARGRTGRWPNARQT